MVQHTEKPEDDFDEFSELENRLRQVRPRTPHVQMTKIASEVVLLGSSSFEPKLTPIRHSWQFVGSMAVSLAAGLLIGAGGMFYSIQQDRAAVLKPNPSNEAEQNDPLKASNLAGDPDRLGRPVEATAAWTLRQSDIEKFLGEPFSSELGGVLSAGQHLRIAKSKMISTTSNGNNASLNEQPWADADTGSASEVSPSTSPSLLRDLLKGKGMR